jgi:hypothetical protein
MPRELSSRRRNCAYHLLLYFAQRTSKVSGRRRWLIILVSNGVEEQE